MNKEHLQEIAQRLRSASEELQHCNDGTDAVQEWEEEARQASVLLGKALERVDDTIRAYDVKATGEAEYVFAFHPEIAPFAYVATRAPHAHAETQARMFTRDNTGYGLTGQWPTRIFDRRKYPPKFPPVLEYKSGHDGLFYRIIPDFENQTVQVLQQAPEVDWR